MSNLYSKYGSNGQWFDQTTQDNHLQVSLHYSNYLGGLSDSKTKTECQIKVKNISPDNSMLSDVTVKIVLDDNFVNWCLDLNPDAESKDFNFGTLDYNEESDTDTFYVTLSSENDAPMSKAGNFFINALPSYTIESKGGLQFSGEGDCTGSN